MGIGSVTLPIKRPISTSSSEIPQMTNPSNPNPSPNPKPKRAKKKPPPMTHATSSPAAELVVPAGHVSFRLLCHSSRIGGVIGKSGAVIKALQAATSAKIRIEAAPVEDSPDRVITVVAAAGPERERVSLRSLVVGGGGGEEETAEVTKAQAALLKVFDRILEVAAESGAVGAGGFGSVSCRMLADVAAAGAVIGKGGKVVEKIRKESGTKIKMFRDNLPACALPSDEVIEIEGNVLAVKKALVAVSQCLQDRSLVDKTRAVASIHIEAVPQATMPDLLADHLLQRNLVIPILASSSSINLPNSSATYPSAVYPFPLETERGPTLGTKTQPRDIVFKLLCSNEKIGSVIGKGGLIVKALQNETGANISVASPVAGCDDRLITISASEDPETRYSPSQKALVLVFARSEKESGSNKSGTTTARLVVPSNQVGCLLGKGGAIILDIRKATGANIRIISGISGNQVPKCVSSSEEVVQISGDFSCVQDALFNATGKLRDNLLSNTVNGVRTRIVPSLFTETSSFGQMNASSLITDTSSYGRLREPAPLIFATNEPPLYEISPSVGVPNSLGRQIALPQKLDYIGPSHSYDRPPSPRQYAFDRPPSPRQYHYNRPPSPRQYPYDRPPSPRQYAYDRPPSPRQYTLERPPSPQSWQSQMIAGIGTRGIPEIGRGLTSMRNGLELGSGNKSAIVTNTTVEIIVPENVIASVYGENGNNLTRLRQISGARVIVHEPRPGTSDRVIVISGTPDETQAAQSLLHAFILTGPS